jgi:broad specificity phosphatase PhoE
MTSGDGQIHFLLEHMSDKDRTIVVIRHSKRPSLRSIPYDKRPGVELTPEGIVMAREFGESLHDVLGNRRIFLLPTPARRCLMTAMAMEEGLSSRGPVNTAIRADPEIRDPIVSLEKFRELRESFGWHSLIRNWLAGRIDSGILEDPAAYADRLVKMLLDCRYVERGDVLLVIAHDITLFPLIHTYFGRCLTTIDYMNGIVMKSDEERTDIGFDGSIAKITLD